MNERLELLVDAKAALGEGPCWDARKRVLYWVDILNGNLFLYDPLKNTNRSIHLGQFIGAVVPRHTGDVTVVLKNGFFHLDLESETLDSICDPEYHIVSNRFNDGKCDPKGRFWAGTMDIQEQEGKGALYRLDKDHTCHKIRDNIHISNGLAWGNSNHTMYFIDSPTRKVIGFDYDVETGGIENGRTIIDLSHKKGIPDGMTIDQEGMLWIAEWGGWEVSRWNPPCLRIYGLNANVLIALDDHEIQRYYSTIRRDYFCIRLRLLRSTV